MLMMLNKLKEKSSLIGIFWMIVTTIFFVGVTIFVKILGEKIPSSQTAFLRYLFGPKKPLHGIGFVTSNPNLPLPEGNSSVLIPDLNCFLI